MQTDNFAAKGSHQSTFTFQYDVFNRRVVKSGHLVNYFAYDTDDVLFALNSAGTVRNRYLHGPAVDEVLADEQFGGTVLWPLKDQFYNVRDLVNNSGAHYNHYDYDAYGNITGLWNNGLNLSHAYAFQSRERDLETGLNYHRNRYYNPGIGRWISEDPIGFDAGDINLNRFVGNSPTIRIDANGLFEISIGFNAFIPKSKGRIVLGVAADDPAVAGVNWGIEPGQAYWDTPYMFATDNRERAGSRGTSRVVLRGSCDSLDIGQLEPLKPIFSATAGLSHQIRATLGESPFGPEYVAESLKPERAQARKVERLADYSSARSGITAGASAGYPFSSIAPSIDYGFSGDVCRLKDGSVLFRFIGDHNEFPAYEIIINGAVIYDYHPKSSGPGVLNLNSSESFSIKVLIKPDGSVQRQGMPEK